LLVILVLLITVLFCHFRADMRARVFALGMFTANQWTENLSVNQLVN